MRKVPFSALILLFENPFLAHDARNGFPFLEIPSLLVELEQETIFLNRNDFTYGVQLFILLILL